MAGACSWKVGLPQRGLSAQPPIARSAHRSQELSFRWTRLWTTGGTSWGWVVRELGTSIRPAPLPRSSTVRPRVKPQVSPQIGYPLLGRSQRTPRQLSTLSTRPVTIPLKKNLNFPIEDPDKACIAPRSCSKLASRGASGILRPVFGPPPGRTVSVSSVCRAAPRADGRSGQAARVG
jgi:hypothetical protein